MYCIRNIASSISIPSCFFCISLFILSCTGAGGWSPDPQDKHPWLQIDLTRKAHIKTIATQGTFNTYNWVTRYIVLYGDHPSNWKPYFQQGSNWVRENLRLLPSDGEMQYNWSLPDIPAYIYICIYSSSVPSRDAILL